MNWKSCGSTPKLGAMKAIRNLDFGQELSGSDGRFAYDRSKGKIRSHGAGQEQREPEHGKEVRHDFKGERDHRMAAAGEGAGDSCGFLLPNRLGGRVRRRLFLAWVRAMPPRATTAGEQGILGEEVQGESAARPKADRAVAAGGVDGGEGLGASVTGFERGNRANAS